MKTQTNDPVAILEAQLKSIQHTKNVLEKLQERRTKVASRAQEVNEELKKMDAEIAELMGKAGISLGGATKGAAGERGGKGRKRDLPRGVLTYAIYQVLSGLNGKAKNEGLQIHEVSKAVKEQFKDVGEVEGVDAKIRNMLNNSEYFENTGERGRFRLSGKKPEGALFQRLAEELVA